MMAERPIRSNFSPTMNVRTLLARLLLLLIALRVAAEDKPFFIEGEKLIVRKVSGQARVQDLQRYNEGTWSGAAHLWWTGAKPGDSLEVALPVVKAGANIRLGAGFTKAIDYGVFDFSLDGSRCSRVRSTFTTTAWFTPARSRWVPQCRLPRASTVCASRSRVLIPQRKAATC